MVGTALREHVKSLRRTDLLDVRVEGIFRHLPESWCFASGQGAAIETEPRGKDLQRDFCWIAPRSPYTFGISVDMREVREGRGVEKLLQGCIVLQDVIRWQALATSLCLFLIISCC